MVTMKNKDELLRELQEEFARWEDLLGSLREEKVGRRDLSGGLSVKDVVAHLMAWQKLSIARLEAARDNRVPDYVLGPEGMDPDAEENLKRVNAWIHEKYKDTPWAQVYDEWRQGYMRFIEMAQEMPEKALMQPARYTWLKDAPLAAVLDGLYDHHHREHFEPLVKELRGEE